MKEGTNTPTSPEGGERWDVRAVADVAESIQACRDVLDVRSLLGGDTAKLFDQLLMQLDLDIAGFIDANKS